ncbi:hypothetical protein HDU93_005567 [Gonapodya sp. JEL0774]|nr:hypothetical protein HDU93_005567 [Gonapodya sp. JEL0774]
MAPFAWTLLVGISLLPSLLLAVPTVHIPPDTPQWAQVLPKNLLGLSLELSDFDVWAGSAPGKPNAFVNAALYNLKKLTGAAIAIRVGGSSQDKALLTTAVEFINSTYPAPTEASPYPPATNVQISRKFYRLSGNFPVGSEFAWGINLEALNETEAVEQAKAVFDAFYGNGKMYTSNVTLKYLELGNEPDLYSFKLFGGQFESFDVFNLTSHWSQYVAAIGKAVDPDHTGRLKFFVGSFSDAVYRFGEFMPLSVLGANDSMKTDYLGVWAKHFYCTVNNPGPTQPPQGSLLGKNGVRLNVSIHSSQLAQVESAGLELVMGETNTAARHGIIGISNAAEGIIYLVDYSLQLASVGIKRLHLHNGLGYAYSILQPAAITVGPFAADAPKIQAAYYAAFIVNELIGKHYNTKIVELTSNFNNVAAYAVYEDSCLSRAILINHKPNFPNSTVLPDSINLSGELSDKKIYVKRFYSPFTNSTSGFTWGGQSLDSPLNFTYNATAGRTPVTNQTLQLNPSEIAMLFFE